MEKLGLQQPPAPVPMGLVPPAPAGSERAAGSQCQARKGWARWPDGPASPLAPSHAGSHSEGILPSRGTPPTSRSARPMAAVTASTVYQAHTGGRDSTVLLGPSLHPGRKLSPGRRINSNPGRTGLGDQQGGHEGQPALFSGTEGPSQEEGLRNEFARPARREGCPRGPEERVERGWGWSGLSACPPQPW